MIDTAIIVVDVQLDFCEGGRLAVEGGNNVAGLIRSLYDTYGHKYLWVKTRDFHDPYSDNDGHFAPEGTEPDYQNNWPVHCTIGSEGVRLHPEVAPIKGRLFSKGYKANDYSGFAGRACNELLDTYLKKNGITHVAVVGIAGEFCVRATAISAVEHGYTTVIIPNLVASLGGFHSTLKVYDEIQAMQRR